MLMTSAFIRTLAVAVTMLALGWSAGRSQAPAPPDFELLVDAPPGETTIECVRGCALAWVQRGVNPSAVPIPKFTYSCSGSARCSSGRVGGWTRQSPIGLVPREARPVQGTWPPPTATSSLGIPRFAAR
jgi:hypothetical protein